MKLVALGILLFAGTALAQTPTPLCPPGSTPGPVYCPAGQCSCCLGDADKQGFINSSDFAAITIYFGQFGVNTNGQGDANCDGIVNYADNPAVQQHFGTFCFY